MNRVLADLRQFTTNGLQVRCNEFGTPFGASDPSANVITSRVRQVGGGRHYVLRFRVFLRREGMCEKSGTKQKLKNLPAVRLSFLCVFASLRVPLEFLPFFSQHVVCAHVA